MVNDCQRVEDIDKIIADSHQKPIFLFKHSTRCPISASRWKVFQAFADKELRSGFYKLLVIEDGPLSQRVAQEVGIQHQSPQAILFYRGKPVWNASHYSITEEDMTAALDRALSS